MKKKIIAGSNNRFLEIDLSGRSIQTTEINERSRLLYLGGKGLGLKLLAERLSPDTDPLDAPNYIVFMTGIFAGTDLPCSDCFSALTKSPLTGIITTCSCSGAFGRALKTSGYDGLLITGKSDHPVYMTIGADSVGIHPADHLWGLDTYQTQEALGPGLQKAMLVIGPAGESQVSFANVASGRNYFGRGGLGAVMGAKKLKAIIATGSEFKIIPRHPAKFKKTQKLTHGYLNRTNMIKGEMHKDSTARVPPEHETVALLGIYDPGSIYAYNDRCNRLGMDTSSTSSVIAWVMEAGERGIVMTNLKFGQAEGLVTALESIAYRTGFGDEMSKGARYLGRTYRGEDFAIQVKGLDLAAYAPRGCLGQDLSYAVANSDGHPLSAATSRMESSSGLLSPYTTKAKACLVIFFENLFAAVNSLHIRPFSVYACLMESPIIKYTPKALLGRIMTHLPRLAFALMDVSLFCRLYSSMTGIKISQRKLLETGARIHMLERLLNNREGISRKDDTLPTRWLFEGHACDPQQRSVPLTPMLKDYYRLRGYTISGVPTVDKLHQLCIGYPENFSLDFKDNAQQFIVPRVNPFKKYYLLMGFRLIGRAIEVAAKMNTTVKTEFDRLPIGFSFCLMTQPDGPSMIMRKDKKGYPRYSSSCRHGQEIDLKISIANPEAAFLLFSLRESIITSVSRNRLIVDGDISAANAVIRIFNNIETYLLPKPLVKPVVRRYPKIGFFPKILYRGLIYVRTLAGV